MIKFARFSTTRELLIKASLLHVNTYGWNSRAIAAAALDLQLSSAVQGILAPVDLAYFCMHQWNKKTQTRESQFVGTDMKERLGKVIKMRLEQQVPYISRWSQAMALGAVPQNISSTIRIHENFLSWAYKVASGTSMPLDFSYYSKQARLVSVFAATQLFMLTDRSPDLRLTWEFLDRRLEDSSCLGALLSGLEGTMRHVVNASSGIWSGK